MGKSKIESYIEEIIDKMGDSEKAVYRELADFCLYVPLKPKKVYKSNVFAVDFINTTNNNTILRFGVSEDGTVVFKLRYYASKDYSDKFHQVIRDEINASKGKWVGCNQCGKEHGQKKKQCHTRYKVQMPDGKVHVRCGFEPVSIEPIIADDLPEVKKLILIQNTFFHEGLDYDEFISI